MLFLAVFCGFLAEYQLEHKIEKDRELQYIRSLLDDLKKDTAILQKNVDGFRERMQINDSLMQMLYNPQLKENGSALYYWARQASRSLRLAIHDATYQQLKNSGGLRLIRSPKTANAIVEYYNHLVFINYLQHIEDNETSEYRLQVTEIFHPGVFREMISADNKIIRPAGNPSLLTYDPQRLAKLAGMVSYITNTKLGLQNAQKDMKAAAIALIALIKQEYHLK